MGQRKEEELNGHYHSGDDTSDDEGHSLKKSAGKEERPKKEEGSPKQESHVETSSSSSSASSFSSSSSSSTSTSHHHHQDGDNGAQAPGEEEVVSPVGRDDAMVESTVVEEQQAVEETEEGTAGTRDEGEDGDSEASDAPVYDKFLVETSLKEDQKTNGKASELYKQESVNDYNVVISETVEGIHDASEKHDAPPAPVAKIVVPEEITAPENSEKLVAEESTVLEERKISDAVEGEAHEGIGNGVHEGGKDVVEEQAIEESEFEANGIALEGETGATDLTPEESKSKNGQENGGRQSVRELSVELGSPLDHQKRYIRQFMTPSPPKRENSVYKIVMALEGLQVGEKCIHGEIDHGTCHQRYGDRRMSSSPSFSTRAQRETSASPKEGDTEVRVSNDEKTEVDSDWSFVQHDSQSGVTTQQSSTVKTETYTDTVVFRRDDGFLPRTPGRSPLSGSQSMRAVFNQADASGSTTPRLKIVHEFPAERTDDAAVEGESEVERILRLQETHDLVCPVCRSCITKRVILRKRKRTTVVSTNDQWVSETVQDSDSEENVTDAHDTDVERYEDYGCLGCFTFLFRRERSVQRTQAVEVSRTEDAAASVTPITQATDQSAARLPAPPALTDADYDNRCLPIFFTWRRKTTTPTDAEIVAPLLRKEEKDTLSEESISEEVKARDVPELEDQTRGTSSAAPGMQLQPPLASEILDLPPAPGPVEGVQLPVVVVETREDRLCFPFLWRRASKTTTTQPEILQPLLEKEAITDQSEQQSSEIDQLSVRDSKKSSVVDEQRRTEDFSRIEDDLWMRREVLLEVPVSVPPQEELTDSPEAVAEADASFKTIRVTEAERKVDCLCFPSWISSETTSEETESSRVTNSSQVEASVIASKTTVDTSVSSSADSSTTSKTTVDTSVAEMSLSSPSLKEGVVIPVAPSTEGREPQRATLNCIDILIPSYPWGPPGTGSRKESLERPEERSGTATEEHSGSATSTQFEFSAVDQVVVNAGVVTEQVASEGFTSLAKKPQEVFQTAIGSVKESRSQAKESQGTENEISTMIAEDSRCLPLLLPTISWRRQEAKVGEILDQSSKSETGEAKSSVTSERKSSKSETGGIKSSVTSEQKSFESETGDIKSSVTSERISSTTSIVSQSSETRISNEKKVEWKEPTFGDIEVSRSQSGQVEWKGLRFGDIEVSRSQSGQQVIQIHNDFAAEVMEEEEVPLVRRKPLTPSEVEPMLPAEEKPQVVIQPVETDDSGLLPEVERDFIFSQDVTRTTESRRADEEKSRDKASWSSCLPSASPDVTVTPSLPPVVDVTLDDERRETGSWSCCLPSYTQLSSQPLEDAVNGEEAVSGGPASESYVSESSGHEEVTRETIVEARVTTQTTTTSATESGSIDSIKVDTSVSYVHASVQHDKDAVEGTLHLDDHPTFNLHPAAKEGERQVTEPPLEATYSTGYAVLAGFLEDEEANAKEDAAINERLAKRVEPLKPVTEVDSSREEITRSEAVTEGKASTVSSEQIIKQEVSSAGAERTQAQVSVDQEEDRSCCLPSSQWRWGRSKLSSEAAQLREPLLGADYAQSQVSGLPPSKVDTTAQQTEETTVTTGVRDRRDESCSCLPWSGRRDDLAEAQLREPLLQQDTASEQLLRGDSEVDSKSDSSAHVTIEQTHAVAHTTTGPSTERDVPDEERCNCLPWSTRRYSRVDTTVTVTSDDTVIQVEGSDAANTLAAATAAAEGAGMMDAHPSESPELLKSVVYGGLDVSLASLGVVASAAGGDAKTRNILALGLANLIFGFIAFYYKIQDMHKESPARFQQSVGPRFWINGPLAMLSFLFFGALPVLVFGFSFRELNDYDYKMAATVLASTIAIVFLGCGKVAANMTELSYRRTLTTLISTGIVAAVAGFYTGEYISMLLAKYGILDD